MQKEGMHIRRSVAAVVVVAALAVGGIVGTWAFGRSGLTVLGAAKVPLVVAADRPINVGTYVNGFAAVVKPVLPAVVNISSSKIIKAQRNLPDSQFFNDPFFQQFFGNQFGQMQRPRDQREKSLGSGVILSADGYILTNNHVVDGASDIRVSLNDKREFQAKVIGTDPKTDVAVLKISASGLPTMPLGDSSRIQVGDLALAIGDPFGLGETVTMGIVSATGRSGLGIEGYEDFIQTDASINPGNSGGALINASGNLIGINTAILAGEGGGNRGIGFAIPINLARNVMEQILQHGRVVRGYLGVHIQNVTPELAKAFGIQENHGALVADVAPGTPGARAGIEKGDIILALDGQPVEDINQLTLRIMQMSPGTLVHLKIVRNGQPRDVAVTLGELPEKNETVASNPSGGGALDGVQVEDLTPDIARQLGLPALAKGVVVTDVDPASVAADRGLQRGDVIQEVNRQPVSNMRQYEQAMSRANKQQALLLVNRGGATVYLVIEAH